LFVCEFVQNKSALFSDHQTTNCRKLKLMNLKITVRKMIFRRLNSLEKNMEKDKENDLATDSHSILGR